MLRVLFFAKKEHELNRHELNYEPRNIENIPGDVSARCGSSDLRQADQNRVTLVAQDGGKGEFGPGWEFRWTHWTRGGDVDSKR